MGQAGGRYLVTKRDRRAYEVRMRILDAALLCLVEAGYAGASTVMIQRRAGVSRGGLLHHFPSKDSLLVAAAQHLATAQVAQAAASAAEFHSPDGSPDRIDEAVAAMWVRFQELYFRAATELWVAAVHNEELRVVLGPAERRLNAAVREAVAAMFGPVHAAHPSFPTVCNVLVTSMRGLAFADVFDGRAARHRRHLADWVHLSHSVLLATG